MAWRWWWVRSRSWDMGSDGSLPVVAPVQGLPPPTAEARTCRNRGLGRPQRWARSCHSCGMACSSNGLSGSIRADRQAFYRIISPVSGAIAPPSAPDSVPSGPGTLGSFAVGLMTIRPVALLLRPLPSAHGRGVLAGAALALLVELVGPASAAMPQGGGDWVAEPWGRLLPPVLAVADLRLAPPLASRTRREPWQHRSGAR